VTGFFVTREVAFFAGEFFADRGGADFLVAAERAAGLVGRDLVGGDLVGGDFEAGFFVGAFFFGVFARVAAMADLSSALRSATEIEVADLRRRSRP
jgi:uncharacterized protein YjbI with pentapeptide repeats